ncbi:type 4 pilus major pilin [Herbaspirillum sp. GCM10030257]|uniref:type 4 pilus major pilin n=1 Tax=Herbaspirillum sp. GCM10030257 TaxID=3273393 RepID=UPI00362016EF
MKNVFVNNHRVVDHRIHQRGASLLEGIAYLGIAAIVILGAVSLLGSAFGSAQSNQSVEEVVSIRTAVRKLYSGQTYAAGDLTPTLMNARALPGSLRPNAANNAVTNTWGGAVVVTGAGATFTVTYNAVPEDVCVNMISGATGWTQITANANGNPVVAFPVTAAAADGLCVAGPNVIVFTAV